MQRYDLMDDGLEPSAAGSWVRQADAADEIERLRAVRREAVQRIVVEIMTERSRSGERNAKTLPEWTQFITDALEQKSHESR
jgi:hypothetical protein